MRELAIQEISVVSGGFLVAQTDPWGGDSGANPGADVAFGPAGIAAAVIGAVGVIAAAVVTALNSSPTVTCTQSQTTTTTPNGTTTQTTTVTCTKK
jgi:hypothetical protein